MLETTRARKAERELDKLIDARGEDPPEEAAGQMTLAGLETGRQKANAAAARLKAEDRERIEEARQENRIAWIDYHERLQHYHAELPGAPNADEESESVSVDLSSISNASRCSLRKVGR